MAVAIAALVIAASGSAVAASSVTSKGLSNEIVVKPFRLNGGQSKLIAKAGALKLVAKCLSGSPVSAEFEVVTSRAHTSLDAGPQNNDFGPGKEHLWGPISTFEANGTGAVLAPGGSAIYNSTYLLAGGDNVQNHGHCVFGGTFRVG
jgi:hypothetical protein